MDALRHPDPRPLVRHAFWPKDYFPLRKDAVPPDHFDDDSVSFTFTSVGGEGVYDGDASCCLEAGLQDQTIDQRFSLFQSRIRMFLNASKLSRLAL